MTTHKTGGEVDTDCSRCKMLLAHTILAMVGPKIARVKCNTCGSEHAFHGGGAAGGRRTRSTKSASAREPAAKARVSITDVLMKTDVKTALPYAPGTRFVLDQLINHPTFGLGIVTGVRGDKVDVAFKAFEKTLAHARTAAAPAKEAAGAAEPAPATGASAPGVEPA